VARTSTDILRVEGGVGLAHEGGLQHVSTLAVLEEPALVQVHLLTGCLEIQSNWRERRLLPAVNKRVLEMGCGGRG